MTESTSATQTAIDTITAQIGEKSGVVRAASIDWMPFLQEGVIVNIHLRRWRAETKVTLEDLGITPENDEERDAIERTLSPGRRYLLPKEILRQATEIDGRSRNWLFPKNAFKTAWGMFIHAKNYARWRERDEVLRGEYLALGDRVAEEYDALITEVRDDYRSLGRQTYRRMMGTKFQPDEDVESWVEKFVDRSLALVPPAETIRASFEYTRTVEMIPLMAQVAQDRAAAIDAITQATDRRNQAALVAMREDLWETERKAAAEGIGRFVADVQAQIQELVYSCAVDGLEALKSGDGKLGRGATYQLKNMVESVNTMVFWDDPDLERRVQDLKDLVEVPAAKRDGNAVREALTELGEASRLVLARLERTPVRSGRDVGITDNTILLTSRLERKRKTRDALVLTAGDIGDRFRRGSREEE